ncbi:spermidine/putrescine ABC transporter substrate-binding protein [Pseudomonas alcaligenes]|uniref:Spermidine/putrescine ABC transporter substrate-binding protein n=1 Tax=Aquipseudomonas alcaligenes TaxID=43263 RepID=A0ABR7S7M8_AQUAC|nr:ABC transporter substrate-binding protein [Pseudomonas alcaligenes]MBC9252453.1 spermidine/putrescine ABC transporter substrate-binding protein [Pseudomonas alcaligenes]
MTRVIKASLLLGLMGSAAPVWADYVTVISFGGANKDAQHAAFYEPFKAATGTAVVRGSYDGDLAKLRQMVQMSHVSWDVVEVEAPELARGCAEGLFEPLDSSMLGNPADYVPGTLQPCGVGIFVWSTVLAYNSGKLAGHPAGWADFWDVQKFPGKRGLRWGAKYNLEFALMADGVAPREVYQVLATPAGVERAFRKLDQLKAQIVWWKAGAEPVRALGEGRVVMSSAYNGRIAAAQGQQPQLALSWNGGIYDFDYWALPKGVWKAEQAKRFVSFASQAPQQKVFAERIAYGPVNNQATAQLDPQVLAGLPTAPQNLAQAVGMDATFWATNGQVLEQRFEQWAKR